MTYDDLKRHVQRGDREAANALLPLARKREDEKTILACWRVLHSSRFRAWQAYEAALNTVVKGHKSRDSGGLDSTQMVRSEVIARALVNGNQAQASEDRVGAALLDLARELLDAPDDAPIRQDAAAADRVRELTGKVLALADEEAMLSAVHAARDAAIV